jgi:hypothetical protein
MLLHRKGKLTIAKLKSLRLSYSEVIPVALAGLDSKHYEKFSVLIGAKTHCAQFGSSKTIIHSLQPSS